MPFNQDPFAPLSAAPQQPPKIQAPEAAEPTSIDPDAVPEGTIKEVLAWVGDDSDRATRALDAERTSNDPRKGLVRQLEEKLA